MDTTFDLPDSTDWIVTSLPAFEPLEAALRCEMCKEFYSNPVLTTCSHTFCSICIRRSIAADGKCPSCRTVLSSNKLAPNIAVREVVMRFQEARPKALELARADKAQANGIKTAENKKRKLEDTDVNSIDDARQTRSRQTQRSRRNPDPLEDVVEVLDSEEDGDGDYSPEGTAKCPICNEAMKPELVFNHLDVCTGQSASQGRSTRSKTKTPLPATLQRRQKNPSPPPTRQSQLNYAMMKEGALRKKLQEIGIPSWGNKDLMKRRHIEWLNIFNSNCDADERVRKSKRQLVKELEEWENTQGGRADFKESRVMRKDFDGNGYAKTYKSDFDDLIAQARTKRQAPNAEQKEGTNGVSKEGPQDRTRQDPGIPLEVPKAPTAIEQHPELNGVQFQDLEAHGSEAKVHHDGEQTSSQVAAVTPSATGDPTAPQAVSAGSKSHSGTRPQKILSSPSPDEPIKDVDMSAS